MRVIKFRDVLWQTARKIGLDPDKDNFLVNEAIPLGEFINQWVRRTYPSRDWPEWTKTLVFTPDSNHIVPYDLAQSEQVDNIPRHIFRVFNVYLVDPATTNAPVSLDYTLREEGIHVGFDHGGSVWVKYIEPPPRFTAEGWVADTNYARDDIAYSYTSGYVYKSKTSGNLGHDPSTNFSLPPGPNQPPPLPLQTEIISPLEPPEPGVPGQDQIVNVIFPSGGASSSDIPNPPPLNARFFVEIVDVNGALVGSATSMANGTDTLDLIVTDLSNQLISALTGFTSVTVDTDSFTIRIEDNTNFRVNQAFWGPFFSPNRNVPVQQIQSYIPVVPPTDGKPQVIQFPLSSSSDQVTPGATYILDFREVTGAMHRVIYVSQTTDGAIQILSGLITQLQSAAQGDIFLQTVAATLDTTTPSDLFATPTAISINASIILPGSPWWELVPFPTALADMVMRGGYADILKEWGQTDKGTAEEGQVPQEAAVSGGNYEPMPVNTLTNQQKAVSRYRVA